MKVVEFERELSRRGFLIRLVDDLGRGEERRIYRRKSPLLQISIEVHDGVVDDYDVLKLMVILDEEVNPE
jgi:hypothetical protein